MDGPMGVRYALGAACARAPEADRVSTRTASDLGTNRVIAFLLRGVRQVRPRRGRADRGHFEARRPGRGILATGTRPRQRSNGYAARRQVEGPGTGQVAVARRATPALRSG